MNKGNETPQERRERLRQEELNNNPMVNLKESLDRAENGSLSDLTQSLGWKGTGILILILIIGLIVTAVFFK